jgi:hypothetical protein
MEYRNILRDPQTFNRIQAEIAKVSHEVFATRIGNSASKDYVSELVAASCSSPIRKQITHNQEFKQYLVQNPAQTRNTFNPDAPYVSQGRKIKKSKNAPQYVKDLDVMVKKINKLQKARKLKKREIDYTYEKFRKEKGND